MQTEKRKINEITENEENVRIHGDRQIEELARSITQFGLIRPVVVDENNVILCGHGLFKALKYLGREEVDVVVKRGLTEKEKKKLMLADNKIFSLGVDDYDMIDKIIYDLEGDFDIPGYDADMLKDLYKVEDLSVQETYSVPKLEKREVKTPVAKTITEVPKQENEILESEIEEGDIVFICPNCGEKICLKREN